MKQLVMMVMAVFLLASCQETPKGYVINGVVENMPDGKIYLKTFRNKMFFDVDTADIKDGKFTFKGEVSQPLLYGLATEDMNYPVQLFVENTNMDVTLGNDGETIIVQNSPVNTIFQENQSKVFEKGFDIDKQVSGFAGCGFLPVSLFYLSASVGPVEGDPCQDISDAGRLSLCKRPGWHHRPVGECADWQDGSRILFAGYSRCGCLSV